MDKQRIGRKLGAAILGAVILSSAIVSKPVQAKSVEAGSQENNEKQILAASVQISMTLRIDGQVNTAFGLGTLVENDGQVWIVTHNHWKDLLDDLCLVEFRDARNELLLRMFGFEFKALIARADAGTLILQAPEGLLAKGGRLEAAQIGEQDQVKAGDEVQIAHRQPGKRDKVEMIAAKVEAVIEYKGLPAYQLRSLDGQPVLVGDSGGGMWFEGELVGNLWATLTVPQTGSQEPVVTDTSYAAIYPEK
jgi:hypothetical protein